MEEVVGITIVGGITVAPFVKLTLQVIHMIISGPNQILNETSTSRNFTPTVPRVRRLLLM